MCCRSQREFRQMVVVDISELKIIYPPPPIEERIDIPYALGLKDNPILYSPIVINRDNYIVDGHHRWFYFKKNQAPNEFLKVIETGFEPKDISGCLIDF